MPSTKNIELFYQHRPVANITALKAIDTTSIVDGEIINVGGLGVWQFIKASSITADNITIVAPTIGGGRWIKQTIIENDGSVKLPKTLNANSFAIKSLMDPVDLQDATTKSWVESQIGVENFWDRSGTLLSPHTLGDSVNIKTGCIGNTDSVSGYSSRFITYVNEIVSIDNQNYNVRLPTNGDSYQSFTAVNDDYFTRMTVNRSGLTGTQTITFYQGAGTGGTVITTWTQTITSEIAAPLPIKLTNGQQYTIRFQGSTFNIYTDSGEYTGGSFNGTSVSLSFSILTKSASDSFNINNSTGFVSAALSSIPTLALANGILQIDGGGNVTSSITLPSTTLATTQDYGTNNTTLSNTAFVQAALAGLPAQLWQASAGVLRPNDNYNINLGSCGLGNIDSLAGYNFKYVSSAEALSVDISDTPQASTYGSGDNWFSFTALDGNFITKFQIDIIDAGTANETFTIYKGEGISGTVLWTSSLLGLTNGWNSITVTTPFPLAIGQKYTIRMQGAQTTFLGQFPPRYTGGTTNLPYIFPFVKVYTTAISANFIAKRSTGYFKFGSASDPTEMVDIYGNALVSGIGRYVSHPSFTPGSFEWADIKYVDDHIANITLAEHDYWTPAHNPITPAQSSFPLSKASSAPTKSELFFNGVQQEYGVVYTILGTTLTWLGPTLTALNSIEIWYDIASSGYLISENQIYYVNDAGTDSNSGKSVNDPLKTIGAAVLLVLAQTPSATNKFEIQVIGSGIYNEVVVVVPYTHLNAPSATIDGQLIIQDNSSANVGTIIGSNTTAVHADFVTKAYCKCNTLTTVGLSRAVVASTGSKLFVDIENLTVNASCIAFNASDSSYIYANVKNLDTSASGSSAISIVSNSRVYLTTNNLLQSIDSYHDANSRYYITANNYEKAPFVARATSDVANFCGDNGTYVVPLAYTIEYNGENLNANGFYNDSTYKASYPFNCLVDFRASILLKNITAAAHTYGELAIAVYNASNVLQQAYILDLKNINNTAGPSPIAPSNALVLNGAADVVMSAGYYAQLVVLVEGSTKEITLGGASLAASRFSGTIKQIL